MSLTELVVIIIGVLCLCNSIIKICIKRVVKKESWEEIFSTNDTLFIISNVCSVITLMGLLMSMIMLGTTIKIF